MAEAGRKMRAEPAGAVLPRHEIQIRLPAAAFCTEPNRPKLVPTLGTVGGGKTSMTSLDYQERAIYCRRRATNAASADLRTRWLRAAEAWLVIAIDDEAAFQVVVDAVAQTARGKGTLAH